MEKGYNTFQTAELLGIKVRTVRKYLHDGTIHAEKIPGTNRWVITESEIKRLRGEDNAKG